MKRLQISIEEDLDEALGQLAAKEKTSKAALIRRFVRQNIQPALNIEDDPLWLMAGADRFEGADHDDVIYGPAKPA